MLDLRSECPKCGEFGGYEGEFSIRHHGNAKLIFECKTECSECEYGRSYTNSLT